MATALTPFGGNLRKWFDDIEHDLMERWPSALRPPGLGFGEPWAPAIDIVEKEGKLEIKADLPGVKQEDIQLLMDDGNLRLQAERRKDTTVEEKGFRRIERSYGRFERVIPLPDGVDSEAITANYRDGVLELSVPLPAAEPKPQPKKIEIA